VVSKRKGETAEEDLLLNSVVWEKSHVAAGDPGRRGVASQSTAKEGVVRVPFRAP